MKQAYHDWTHVINVSHSDSSLIQYFILFFKNISTTPLDHFFGVVSGLFLQKEQPIKKAKLN